MRAGNRAAGLVGLAVIWLLVINLFGSGCSTSSQVFGEGVRIASIPVGGLLPDEARELLVPEMQLALQRPVVFNLEERTWRSSLGDLGVSPDLDSAINQAAAIGRGGIRERIAASRRLREEGCNIAVPYLCDEA
ncbi:MAG: hypothetical protein QHH02_09435, partial [Syntrophomonadaceae bacterium]|nr:hypothetical protein [Syntrophomonadaceae bacterium]